MSDPKAVKTETVVRTYNEAGDVLSEKYTVVVVSTPAEDEAAVNDYQTGMYL